jgi:8-oxo-dGTP diphosphatase
MNQKQPDSAPAEIRFCPRCATPLVTRPVSDKPRRACPACHFIHFTDPKVGVGVLVIDQGKVLLVRRVMMPEQGKWSIPAGFLDSGEDPKVTAVREVLEETNLQVQIESLIDIFYNPPGEGGASIFILYYGRLLGGDLCPGDDADAAAFFGPDSLPDLAFTSTQQAIQQWQANPLESPF